LYQWDYPACWPPIFLLTAEALNNYGFKKDAVRICKKYLNVVSKNFENPNPKTYLQENILKIRDSGFIYEKYNVISGGINDLEYPANQFFGWSAGIFV